MSITITTGINSIDSNPTYLNSIANPSTKFYSSKLVNYVEPIEISGYRKTVFYSEVNTNFMFHFFLFNSSLFANRWLRLIFTGY